MPIEYDHTRVELIQAEDAARYLLRDHAEVLYILRALAAARTLVSVRLLPGTDSFLSTVVRVADDGSSLLLDGSADNATNQRIERAERLDCVTRLDKIRIEFALSGHRPSFEDGRPGFRAALPDEVLRLQRREFFRLQTPATHSITCLLPLPTLGGDERQTELRIIDISGGGVAVAVPPTGIEFGPGAEFRHCMLNLPDSKPIDARLVVRNVFRITNRDGIEMLRAGCQFLDMPRGAEDQILRYIMRAERERSARHHNRP